MTTIDEITIAVKQFINDYTLGLAYPIPTEPYVEPAEQPSEPKGMNFDCFSISIRVCSQWTLRFLNVFVLFHFYLLFVIAHFNLSILHSLFCFDQKMKYIFKCPQTAIISQFWPTILDSLFMSFFYSFDTTLLLSPSFSSKTWIHWSRCSRVWDRMSIQWLFDWVSLFL